MDAEHRHELKENDLQEFLLHFRQWWERNGRKTLMLILVVAVVITAWRWMRASAEKTHEMKWANLATATTPDAGLLAADEAHTDGLRNLARLRSADMWLLKAARPTQDGNADASQKTPQQMLEDAQRAYEQITNDPGARPVFRLNAMLGLASIAEARDQWDRADSIYEDVKRQAEGLFPAHLSQAVTRQRMLKLLARPVAFAPEPPEESSSGDGEIDAAPSETSENEPPGAEYNGQSDPATDTAE